MTSTAAVPDLDTAAAVLGFARDRRAAADAAEADLLGAACAWAELHPAESIADAVRFGDTPVPVAGPGAPLVAEFAVAEFAAAVGLPTETGKAYLGEALELRHRLPRTWARVHSGDLPAWRARRIARATIALSPAAAGFVDDQVAGFAHRVRPSGVDRLVEEAIVRFMPEEARRRREAAADGRHVHVHTHQVSYEGTVWVEAEVDLADALDLDTALSAGAARLADLGSTASLDVRRSEALGAMARHQLSLDLDTTNTTDTDISIETPAPTGRTPGRQVVLHVHLSEQALRTPDGTLHLARVANTRSFVDADQVRTWCGVPGTTVTVKPVLDLAEHLHVDQYQVPDRLADQAAERDLTCVFPWCTRPAEPCDIDHVIPYSEGGATASDNLAPLCRRHHRLKTHHSGWGYTVLEPGCYLWHSPHGYQFLRDHTGTTDVTRDPATHPPDR
jgi:5-methylcytosine-specific restriction endonuclease McrA